MRLTTISRRTLKSRNLNLSIPKKRGKIPLTINFLNLQSFLDKMENHQLLKAASITK
jgi:hypothetical protein